jgi:hypothetical protein
LLCAAGRAWGSGGRAGRAPGGLVVPVWVEKQFAEQFAGGGVNDADVQVLDQEQDVGSGVGSADADMVEFSAVAEVTTPEWSMRSRRTRWWVSADRSPGAALGRAA